MKLDDLEKLEREATPGPWTWNHVDQLVGPDDIRDYGLGPENHPTKIIETDSGVYPPSEADAALIPAMRNALPKLLAVAKAARGLRNLAEIRHEHEGPHDYGRSCPACVFEAAVDALEAE